MSRLAEFDREAGESESKSLNYKENELVSLINGSNNFNDRKG